MNMYRPILLSLLLATAVWAALPRIANAQSNAVEMQFQVFRVLGDFSGDLSLTDDIWSGIDGPKLETKRAFTFFTTAKANLADVQLTVDNRGWFWNGTKEIPFGADGQGDTQILGDRVTLLASPTVSVPVGSSASIVITGEQTVQYFERLHDNTFELKTMKQPTGLTFSLVAERKEEGRILLKDLTVTSRIVEQRKPIDGVTLNVGEPVLKTRELKASMNIKPGKDYGILLHAEDMRGLLLIRLRAGYVPSVSDTEPISSPSSN